MDADSRISVVKFDPRTWDGKRFRTNDYVYIGRANPHYRLPQSVFANIYSIDKNAQDASLERLRVIRLYDAYVDENQAILTAIRALKARLDSDSQIVLKLVCWCFPEPCHGDVIKRRVLQYNERENGVQERLF